MFASQTTVWPETLVFLIAEAALKDTMENRIHEVTFNQEKIRFRFNPSILRASMEDIGSKQKQAEDLKRTIRRLAERLAQGGLGLEEAAFEGEKGKKQEDLASVLIDLATLLRDALDEAAPVLWNSASGFVNDGKQKTVCGGHDMK